jgi:hypothetical protein
MGQCRRRHQEFLQFLGLVHPESPGKIPRGLVMDNYGTQKGFAIVEHRAVEVTAGLRGLRDQRGGPVFTLRQARARPR